MYYVIANKIVGFLLKKGYIENKKRGQTILEYSLALLVNVLIASGIGHTLDMENQMVVFSVFYTLLRISNGGNYLKLDTKNTVSLWGFGAAAILGMEYIVESNYGNFILLGCLVVSFLIVILFQPLKVQKINVSEDVLKDLSRRSKMTISIECISLGIGIWTVNSNIIAAAIIGVFIQSMSLLLLPSRQLQIVDLKLYGIS